MVSCRKGRIKLLLHCENGCVPFLTPSQLEKYFPPSESNLWLGIAVGDCCIAPIFDGNDNECTTTRVKGYTFAANAPDSWLKPYTRLSVPSFDLDNNEERKSGPRAKNSNNAMLVWTPHGRQKLTPKLYATASLKGLQSQHTLSLFDDMDKEDYSEKRKEKAESRNENWFRHLCQESESRKKKVPDPDLEKEIDESFVWKPILLSGSSYTKFTDDVSGVAFVGRWSRSTVLNAMEKDSESIRWKAILSTFSLSDIIDIASEGTINIIGTNLPQKWAKEKLAIGHLDDVNKIMLPKRDNKRRKKMTGTATQDDTMLLNDDGCMNLSDSIYALDPNPLVVGCRCMGCLRYSRAYVHHLVRAKEMLAEIIIFGHNLHCLLDLLRTYDSP